MAWQVRHIKAGLFMGVSHGKGHYSNCSECCRTLGVYQFHSQSQIESLFEMATSPHLPEHARLEREDFVVEEWNLRAHDLLLDEGVIDDCAFYLQWSNRIWPLGLN